MQVKNLAPPQRVAVLGVGNILCRDEGIGVRVVERLQQEHLPTNVEVMDCGTAGLDVVLSIIEGVDSTGSPRVNKLIVIDALKAGKKAGTIYKAHLNIEEKDRITQLFSDEDRSKISLHQVGLFEALGIAEKFGCAPREIVIIGVEPAKVDCGLELTEQVRRKLPEIIEKVLEEINNVVYTE
jgi:hydrogenase maturation protease